MVTFGKSGYFFVRQISELSEQIQTELNSSMDDRNFDGFHPDEHRLGSIGPYYSDDNFCRKLSHYSKAVRDIALFL